MNVTVLLFFKGVVQCLHCHRAEGLVTDCDKKKKVVKIQATETKVTCISCKSQSLKTLNSTFPMMQLDSIFC